MKKRARAIICILIASFLVIGASSLAGANWFSDFWEKITGGITGEVTGKAVDGSGDFVGVRGSKFYLNGQEWRPFGVSYWPSYSNFSDTYNQSLHWLDNSQYKSSTVAIELAHIKNIGFNAINIQSQAKTQTPCANINDVLSRAGANNLKVLLFIPFCDAVHYEYNLTKCLNYITQCGFANNPAIFAYSIALEPRVWDWATKGKNFNKRFTNWLIERYGSLANAEASLGYTFSYSAGNVNVPTISQLNGDTTKFVQAFRRFFDDLVSNGYTKTANEIKKIDASHLISGDTGALLVAAASGLTDYSGYNKYDADARATAYAFDFIGVETYNDLSQKSAGFLADYASFGGKKPVVFVEYGYGILEDDENQKQSYKNFYDRIQEAGVQGSFAWWYVTGLGYRLEADGTRYDYGIVKYLPYLQERPVVSVIKQYATALKNQLSQRIPNSWVFVDTDSQANLYKILAAGLSAYKYNLDKGLKPIVLTACSETDSKTPYRTGWPQYETAMKCVGNAPFNWKCPPKCLNAQFNYLQIKNASDDWQEIADNAVVYVAENAPIYLKASIANIGESKWLTQASAGGEKGAVGLGNALNGSEPGIYIINNVRFLKTWVLPETQFYADISETKIVDFSLNSKNTAWFGEKIQNVTLKVESAPSPDIPPCTEADWTSSLSPTTCPSTGQQTKTWSKIGQCSGGVSHPATETVSCTYNAPACTYTYSSWSECTSSGTQTRTVLTSSPANCQGTPALSQACNYIPPCTEADWQYAITPAECPATAKQTRTWTLIGACTAGIQKPASEEISCIYNIPACTSFTYSDWSSCSSSEVQTRTIATSSPSGCVGGNPVTSQACVYIPTCTENNWEANLTPASCPASEKQNRTWTLIGACTGGVQKQASEMMGCDYHAAALACTNFTYSDWSDCLQGGLRTRTINSSLPANCDGGNPTVSETCTYTPANTGDGSGGGGGGGGGSGGGASTVINNFLNQTFGWGISSQRTAEETIEEESLVSYIAKLPFWLKIGAGVIFAAAIIAATAMIIRKIRSPKDKTSFQKSAEN